MQASKISTTILAIVVSSKCVQPTKEKVLSNAVGWAFTLIRSTSPSP